MHQFAIHRSSESQTAGRAGLRHGRRSGTSDSRVRGGSRSRRFLLYTGFVLGFCALLAFAGCGSIEGNGGLLVVGGGVNFGSVTVGSIGTATVSLMNGGGGAVSVSSVHLSGGPFTIASSATFPVSVAAGGTFSFQVQFAPSAAGEATGTITVLSSVPGSAPTVSLAGLGVSAGGGSGSGSGPGVLSGISCSKASMVGSGTDNCTVTLSGPAASGGLAISLASNSSSVTVPAGVTVSANATSATFAATVAAVPSAQTASLTAAAGGITKAFSLQLNAALKVLTANASQVSFGTVALNSTATQSLVLSSTGTQAVTVQSAALTGAGFSLGAVALPVTLNPGQSITLQLGFLPTLAGAASGQITVTSDATSGATMAIPLSGSGGVAYAVNLTWNAPASSPDPVVSYRIYRAVNGAASYQLLNSAANPGTTYTDTTVANGQSYVYVVTSVDAGGMESVPSNTFAATIP
ncbi:MAG TPA: choice-of-anchor D domain-containing protein [Acidobacteriaceae bacterium]|nr:choice-of-anchor D domain-containing protein [Acidobacteriaceae bacterium]